MPTSHVAVSMFGTRRSNRALAAVGAAGAALLAVAALASLLGRTLASGQAVAAVVSLAVTVGALAVVVGYSVTRTRARP